MEHTRGPGSKPDSVEHAGLVLVLEYRILEAGAGTNGS